MASLKDIKLKVLSYKKTGTVTHAMEAVSAVKMRKSQERALSGRSYAAAALSILERVAGTADAEYHPLVADQSGKTLFIVVTSDKGLAGSLNSSVIRKAEEEIRARSLPKNDVVIIAVGRRGGDYFLARGYDVRIKQENLSDGVDESGIKTITDKLIEWRMAGEVGNCVIVYTNFVSTFEQEAVARQIVPVTREMMRTFVSGIRPVRGKFSPPASDQAGSMPAAYTIEPDVDTVLAALMPKLVNVAIFHGILEAKASEHSARMVAMKSATDKAKEMAHDLTRVYNKVRQAAITREVSEITSGIEAMK